MMEMTEEAAEKIWHGGPEAFQIVRELYADMVRKLDGFEQNAKLLLDACEKLPLVWIPVEERLPEDSRTVLACLDDRSVVSAFYSKDDRWFETDYGCYRATHWMPLPEPPEVK